MPIHGLETDLELLFLAVTAGLVSFFATGEVISNVLFTFLLASLFFLEGLHFSFRNVRTKMRDRPFSIGFSSVFLLIPVLSLLFAFIYPRFQDLFLVLGVSTVSIGSPLVWSNVSGGNGQLTEKLSTALLGISLVGVPFLILAVLHLKLNLMLVAQNLYIVLVPFLIGVMLHNSRFEPIENARFHFSKLSFWLIVLITLVQLQIVLESKPMLSIASYVALTFVMALYVFFSFLSGYIPSKLYGLNEKDSRSIGFVSSSRNVGIAFFLGSLISGEVVLLVGLYYFVRQVVGLGIADILIHDETKFRERLGLKG